MKLDGALTTHFSKIVHFVIDAGKTLKLDVPLETAKRIDGVVSANVPRPVRNGRVVLDTYRRDNGDLSQVEWGTWVPIRVDGTFTIPGWPVGERLQLIAMCDHFVAESGNPPEPLDKPPPANDSFLRPQVYEPFVRSVQVAMTPMVACDVTAIDEDKKPIADIQVNSYPNVGWWGNGSQVYCGTHIRGEQLLVNRDHEDAEDDVFPYPFEAVTDANGKARLMLPVGYRRRLWTEDENYLLPRLLGKQMTEPFTIVAGEPREMTLKMKRRKNE